MPKHLKTISATALLLVVPYIILSGKLLLLQLELEEDANQPLSRNQFLYYPFDKTKPSRRSQERPIPTCMVFLHIPKSGGRSVASFLTAVTLDIMKFTEQRTYGMKNINLTISDLTVDKTFTLGHFTTRLFDEQPKFKQCFTITVLREPIDRAISAFFYHGQRKRNIDKCVSAAMNPANQTGNDKCTTPPWQYSNDMTRRFAGSNNTNWNTKAERKFGVAQPNQKHLEDAKIKLLNEFDMVCYMHKLSSCADEVLRAFHLKRTNEKLSVGLSHMKTNNNSTFKTTLRPDELDEESMEKFRKANKLDIELYKWALNHVK